MSDDPCRSNVRFEHVFIKALNVELSNISEHRATMTKASLAAAAKTN
ncbi:hypothetical protein [Pseudoalteromonas spongiae]|nr:hypothetical protein [Pseudoalteromonas spongiae]